MTLLTNRRPAIAGVAKAFAVAAALICLAGTGLLQAQQWEYIYGSTTRLEDGKFRVIPVNGNCRTDCYTGTAINGYISVGTSSPGQANDPQNADVHVVRSDNSGAVVWEFTYDITANNDWDYGWSIIELADGTGFVVTGETRNQVSGNTDVFLMKISCTGLPVWTNTYGTTTLAEGGRDLIQATTGNALAGTAAGDIVVAGYAEATTGITNAYLLRTTVNGALIWDQTYDYVPAGQPQEDFFYSLDEMTAILPAVTGDIMGVGYTALPGNPPGGRDALAVRVNGDNGAIGLAPQGAAIYGAAGAQDEFSSVIELANPVEVTAGVPNVVAAGSYGGAIYAIKLAGGDPNIAPLIQQTIVGAVGEPMEARTVREITFVPPGGTLFAQWDLILTGTIFNPGPPNLSDAVLIGLVPATLAPFAPLGVYGGQGGSEEGWSVFPVDAINGRTFGFVMCGHSDQNWYNPPIGAPILEMYVIKTDGAGRTGCERPLNVVSAVVTGYTPITLVQGWIGVQNQVHSGACLHNWGVLVCPRPPGVPCTLPFQGDEGDGGILLEDPELANPALHNNGLLLDEAEGKIVEGGAVDHDGVIDPRAKYMSRIAATAIYPNPLKAGDPMRIVLPVGDDAMVTVSNSAGEIVIPETALTRNDKGEVSLRTDGWSSGVYFVTIWSDGDQSTIRLVIID
jgi:hypothetical protein